MHPWLRPLHAVLKEHRCPENAAAVKAYMKGIAPFFGLKTDLRRSLLKAHMVEAGRPDLDELPDICRSAFACREREMHYVAVDLLVRNAKKLGPDHLPLLEELITTKSWWDTVDMLATNAVGPVLRRHPEHIARWNTRWMRSSDMWLNRTALLFQLKWQQDTDTRLLFANIEALADHKDFFIRKAIGWALRAYSTTDPAAVEEFVRAHELSPLSTREGLRLIRAGRV